jgi:hypothetical protein
LRVDQLQGDSICFAETLTAGWFARTVTGNKYAVAGLLNDRSPHWRTRGKSVLTHKESPEHVLSSPEIYAGENAVQMVSVGKAPGVTRLVAARPKKKLMLKGFRL